MLSDYLARQSQERELSWTLVAQAVGIGLLRLEAGSVHQLRLGIADLRGKPDSMAGSLVILDCPPELKHGLDVWGGPGDTLALMKNIKAQFDPAGILNPGRFVGFI
jgi:glycolate oxidase FAD binding subunit